MDANQYQAAGAQDDSGDGAQAEPRDDTFFLPNDFPDADSLKKGDTITLRVLGTDRDGNVEVERTDEAGTESESSGALSGLDEAMK